MRLVILSMRYLIGGQVGIKIITSITGGKKSNTLKRICLSQGGSASPANKISLKHFPILLLKVNCNVLTSQVYLTDLGM